MKKKGRGLTIALVIALPVIVVVGGDVDRAWVWTLASLWWS